MGGGILQRQFLRHLQGLVGGGDAVVMTSEILFIAKYQLERNYRIQHFIHLHLLSSLTPCPKTTEKKTNLQRFLRE